MAEVKRPVSLDVRFTGFNLYERFLLKIGGLFLVAFFALQIIADTRRPALIGQNPWTLNKRRIMSDMLVVAAGKHRAPMALVVPVIADDRLIHSLSRIPCSSVCLMRASTIGRWRGRSASKPPKQ